MYVSIFELCIVIKLHNIMTLYAMQHTLLTHLLRVNSETELITFNTPVIIIILAIAPNIIFSPYEHNLDDPFCTGSVASQNTRISIIIISVHSPQ